MADLRQNTPYTTFEPNLEEFESTEFPAFFRDPMGMIARRWPWMLLAAVLVSGLSITMLVHKGPRYVAESTVLIATQRIPESFVQSTVREDLLPRLSSMMSSVLSREKLGRIIQKHNLYPEFRDSRTLTEIADMVRNDISITLDSAISGKRRRHDTNSRLIRIVFEAKKPGVAAEIANEIAGLLTAEAIQIRSEQVGSTLNFLRGELNKTEGELSGQKQLITAFKESHRGELPSDLSQNLAEIDRLRQLRGSTLSRIADLEMEIRALESSEIEGQPTERDREFAALQVSLRSQLALHTREHPNVEAIERQLHALGSEIERERSESPLFFGNRGSGNSQIAGINRKVSDLQNELAVIAKTAEEVDSKLSRIPMRHEALSSLEARRAVLFAKYTQLLGKVQEAGIAKDLELAQKGEQVSILDLAEPPAGPKRTLLKSVVWIAGACFIIALFIGVAFEHFDPVIVDTDHLKAITNVPSMGAAPVIV